MPTRIRITKLEVPPLAASPAAAATSTTTTTTTTTAPPPPPLVTSEPPTLPPHMAATATDPPTPTRSPQLRSSLLMKLNVRSGDHTATTDHHHVVAVDTRRRPRAPAHHHHHNTTEHNSSDIRGSPRLLGYAFGLIASAVMLVSVVQFDRQRDDDPTTATTDMNSSSSNNDYIFFNNGAVVVYRWKLWGTIFMSSIGAALSSMTIYIHFDTVLAPELWHVYLQDGSVVEQYWILFLILFWSAGVHVCTSTLSVGESQPNVYFATWIAFVSTCMNYGVWCESAHVTWPTAIRMPEILLFHKSSSNSNNSGSSENHHPVNPNTGSGSGTAPPPHCQGESTPVVAVNGDDDQDHTTTTSHPNNRNYSNPATGSHHHHHHHHHHAPTTTIAPDDPTPDSNFRETTFNWLWVGFFSSIFAGAASDIYWNRRNITLRFRGEALNLVQSDWNVILSVVWSEVALCGFAIAMNHCTTCSNTHIIQQPLSFQLPSFLITMNDENKNDNNPDAATTATNNQRYHHKRYKCVFGWRQMEGLLIFLSTGLKFWVILRYAAVDGVIPGLSNAYFGVWGSFFNGVFCLGTWLREHENMEFLVRES